MELEKLLQLLQAYGVTKFKNGEYDLELVSFDRSVTYEDGDVDDEFGIEVSKMEILDNN